MGEREFYPGDDGGELGSDGFGYNNAAGRGWTEYTRDDAYSTSPTHNAAGCSTSL